MAEPARATPDGLGYISPEPAQAEWQHLSYRPPDFRRGKKVSRPFVECGALFLCSIMPLIESRLRQLRFRSDGSPPPR